MSARNTRSAVMLAAILALLSLASVACTSGVSASGPGSPSPSGSTASAHTTSNRLYSLQAGGLTRKYEIIEPGQALSNTTPIIVMLSGVGANLDTEIPRDDLLPYATAGLAELVYPVSVGLSWNAIGCCQYAWVHKVNDLAFLKALVARVDPGHTRAIYLVGYSNGARMAYRVACTYPGLFNAYAMAKGGPVSGCVVTQPTTILQLASVDDPEMPYRHGGQSRGEIPVLTEIARLRATGGCPAKQPGVNTKGLAYTVWTGCADGARIGLAAWPTGKHSFPLPPLNVPSAAQVIWAFFTKTSIKALPA